ncbi:MAG TPA: ATP-dependent zinc metalloprotease FtsH [Pseudomonas sp.]|uniref:ATP-dependent zinc metalloprotease FtsH n=1 Tax=Pseudomonas sp. TaxID=306 RepID=UPI002BF61A41|nr:ATP-dependent zinc metalloprotease FtsH [Pseudomonas sp.]HTO19147.1 ATP-dependent zinc metalloprotease FtsH [Pseudomonas sp.]
MKEQAQFHMGYWLLAILAFMGIQYLLAMQQQVATIPYSEFEEHLKAGRIEAIAVTDSRIEGTLKSPLAGGQRQFVTNRVEPRLAEHLAQYPVHFAGKVESTFLRDLAGWVIPAALFFGIWLFLLKRIGGGMGGGMMQIGKSKAKVYVETDIKVSFADVAGVDEAKDELQEIIDFLRDPETYGRLGGRLPKGVLLVGPPGTGKTLLARAVAGEAGVPFFSISGSEFVELFVGVGAARVRDLFEQARAKAPAIIFIDELDALGRARGAGPLGGGHDEKEQTLNQLLVELDGFDTSSGLVLLAATNRPEILDPALLRAGRFDRQVLVDRPDKVGRVQILGVHLKKSRLAPDVDPQLIAELTPGFTGADLANLVNEATLLATRRKAAAVEMQDFNSAIERIIAGLEKRNRLLNPKEREVVAFHEMGHALVAMALPGMDPVHKVSIIPRGMGALGYTIQRPIEDRFLMTREELEHKMSVLLGGRAAEWLVFAQLSTGAADDLVKATDIARAMVTRYGMSERLGHLALESEPSPYLGNELYGLRPRREYAESTATAIDEEVQALVQAAFERSLELLKARREQLERSARRLLEQETLSGEQLQLLVG